MAVSDKKKRIQVTLSKQTTKKLEECSDWQGLSKSQVIESAVIKYLEEKGFYKDEDRLLFL
ncbi:CopG family transcriptional regulator [Streptococcus orisratti]|uniref:ribbon-helix-helix domain-containing protein n=1 Tax=Streptococcus orisratti TaxID=114652 RepID=UPI0023F894C2|nr:CopG family transcriptional regulator [Streptococcus orisratti]